MDTSIHSDNTRRYQMSSKGQVNVSLLTSLIVCYAVSTPQVEVWSLLSRLLNRSQSNVRACRPLRLLERCLDSLRKTSSDIVASQSCKFVSFVMAESEVIISECSWRLLG